MGGDCHDQLRPLQSASPEPRPLPRALGGGVICEASRGSSRDYNGGSRGPGKRNSSHFRSPCDYFTVRGTGLCRKRRIYLKWGLASQRNQSRGIVLAAVNPNEMRRSWLRRFLRGLTQRTLLSQRQTTLCRQSVSLRPGADAPRSIKNPDPGLAQERYDICWRILKASLPDDSLCLFEPACCEPENASAIRDKNVLSKVLIQGSNGCNHYGPQTCAFFNERIFLQRDPRDIWSVRSYTVRITRRSRATSRCLPSSSAPCGPRKRSAKHIVARFTQPCPYST